MLLCMRGRCRRSGAGLALEGLVLALLERDYQVAGDLLRPLLAHRLQEYDVAA